MNEEQWDEARALEILNEEMMGREMWYKTKEEAEEACVEKRKEYKREFYVLKDSEREDCYWAQRKI